MTQSELMELMRVALRECKEISAWEKSDDWYAKDGVNWKEVCMLKDKTIALYDKRWQEIRSVIDLIAEELNIINKGFYLYAPNADDRHPILDAIRDLISRSGDKTELKKRISQLESENAVLRSLVGKGAER